MYHSVFSSVSSSSIVPDQPVSKRLRELEADDGTENTASSPKDPGQRPDGPDLKDTGYPAKECKGPELQQEETPGTSQRSSPSGSQAGSSSSHPSCRSSPDSTSSSQSAGASAREPRVEDSAQAGPSTSSQQCLERGSSRESSEEGGSGSSGSFASSGSNQKHLVDRVAFNIEQLLEILQKASSS